MRHAVNVSVFSQIPNTSHFNWYREGTEEEKKRGQHIVVDDILDLGQLNKRLTRRCYGSY